MFLRDRFVERIFYVFFIDFVQKRLPITKLNAPFVLPFFPPVSQGMFSKVPSLICGALLPPFCLLVVPFGLNFGEFRHRNLRFWHPNAQNTRREIADTSDGANLPKAPRVCLNTSAFHALFSIFV
jgi:hypothetical protein